MAVRHFSLSNLIVLAAFTGLIACGNQRPSINSAQNFERPTTGGEESERPYTAYGPAPEIEKVKERVPDTKSNKEFAAQIESAFLLRHHGRAETANALRIQVKLKDLEKPLEFWGEMRKDGERQVATLRDESGQRKGFVIVAACADQDCNVVSADFYNERVLKSAMIFRKETRLIQANLGASEKTLLACYDQKTQALVAKYVQGVKVVVASTEIVPGKTHFKLYEGEPSTATIQVEGALLETNGDCLPLKGDAQSIFAQVCLAGNNGKGSLVFLAKLPPLTGQCKASDEEKKDPTIFLQIGRDGNGQAPASGGQQTPATGGGQPPATTGGQGQNQNPKQTNPPAQNPPQQTPSKQNPVPQNPPQQTPPKQQPAPRTPGPLCTLPVPAEKVHPYLLEIYKDCGHPVVAAKMASNLGRGGKHRSSLTRFLGLADGSQRGRTDGDIPDYTTMKQILKARGVPVSFGFLTVQESGFNPLFDRKSSAGALGYWQFMPQTARSLGITEAQTHQIGPSTEAAAKFLNQLVKQWTKNYSTPLNFKMLLASYNAGPRASDNAKDRMENRRDAGRVQFAALSDSQINRFSEDFWKLYDLGMLPDETLDFVPSVLSLIFGGIRPEQAGLGDIPGFPDLD